MFFSMLKNQFSSRQNGKNLYNNKTAFSVLSCDQNLYKLLWEEIFSFFDFPATNSKGGTLLRFSIQL